MAFRVPLSSTSRNSEISSHKVGKTHKSKIPVMEKTELCSTLQVISDNYASRAAQVKVTSKDISEPTGERVQSIYLMLLNVLFDTMPSSLSKVPFSTTPLEYPDLHEDVAHRANFLKCMRLLLNTCLIPSNDFGPRDITDPEPKRTQRMLSAIVNYIKFDEFIAQETRQTELEEKMSELNIQTKQERMTIEDLEKMKVELERQKIEEQQLEEELAQQIKDQEEELEKLRLHKEDLETRSNKSQQLLAQNEDKLVELDEVLKQLTVTLESIKLKVVISPEECQEKLRLVTQEFEETYAMKQESSDLVLRWEELVSNVVGAATAVIESTGHDIDSVIDKAKNLNVLQRTLEGLQEQAVKSKQHLKELSAKHQNLMRRIKLLKDEKSVLAIEETKRLQPQSEITDLIDEIASAQQQLDHRKQREIEIDQEMEQHRKTLEEVRDAYSNVQTEFEATMTSLFNSFREHISSRYHQYVTTV